VEKRGGERVALAPAGITGIASARYPESSESISSRQIISCRLHQFTTLQGCVVMRAM
jgi:hypothetical protein